MSRYRFALRPGWILSHLLVLALVVTMVNLGLWQLRRLEERRDLNETLVERMAHPTAPAATVLDPGAGPDEVEAVVWRSVRLTGTYEHHRDVLVANRTLGGQPGFWVVTPLRTDGGGTVPVVRGFVNRTVVATGGLVETPPPGGPVRVEGRVVDSRPGRLSPDDIEGRTQISAVDVEVLGAHWGTPMGAWWLQLEAQDPPQAGAPVLQPLPSPDLGDGPHLSYAVQWFIFSTIAVIGYPLVLRNVARSPERRAASRPREAPARSAVGP